MINSSHLTVSKDKIKNYINENIELVNPEYRHKYHFQTSVGWMNDPNGFSYFQGKYHLFYQYFPFDTKWGLMYWGHATSDDLVLWEHKDVALCPDTKSDNYGCYSGTALIDNDEMVIMYTGIMSSNTLFAIDNEQYLKEIDNSFQVQCIARERDGLFVKSKLNPVIGPDKVPSFAQKNQFRDPKLFKNDDTYYAIIGSKTKVDHGSQIPRGILLMYQSSNLEEWEFLGVTKETEAETHGVLECPDYFKLDGEEILIYSEQLKEEEGLLYHNQHSCLYTIGQMNFKTGKFLEAYKTEIDMGLDFYAPQTLLDSKGRRIMIAWLQDWGRNIPTDDLNHGWAGSMTFPRVLTVENGRLIQNPIEEIEKYRQNHIHLKEEFIGNLNHIGINGKFIDLNVEIQIENAGVFGVEIFVGDNESTMITYDVIEEMLIFDRTKSLIPIVGKHDSKLDGIRKAKVKPIQGRIKMRLLMDNSSVELFVNDGELAMSHTVYSGKDSNGINFFSDDMITIDVDKYDLVFD